MYTKGLAHLNLNEPSENPAYTGRSNDQAIKMVFVWRKSIYVLTQYCINNNNNNNDNNNNNAI